MSLILVNDLFIESFKNNWQLADFLPISALPLHRQTKKRQVMYISFQPFFSMPAIL